MTTGRRGPLRTTAWLLAASFVTAHLCFALLPGAFEPWNLKATDLLFRLRDRLQPAPYDRVVAYVEVGDRTLEELGTPYLNRSHYAKVVRNLAAMGVARQVQDVVFKGPADPADDRLLTGATHDAGNVIFGFVAGLTPDAPPTGGAAGAPRPWRPAVEGDTGAFPVAARPEKGFAPLAAEAKGLGFIDLEPDRDGVFRRAALLVRAGDGFHPSLALLTAADYLGVAPEAVVVRPGDCIVLRGARRPGGAPRDIAIPIDAEGRTRVNFLGPWKSMDHYAFARVHEAARDPGEMEVWRARLEGRIVIVTDASTAAQDLGPTPLEASTPLSQVHANVLHSILAGCFVREASPWTMLPIELVLLALVGVLARRGSRLFLAGTAGLAALFLVGAALLFLRGGILLHLVRPLMMVAIGFAATLSYRYLLEERQKAALRGSFEAYFPPALVQRLLLEPERIAVGGERKELTVLFSDIREFTARTVSAEPKGVQRLLNEYFEAMVEVVFRHGGTVDKFIGDGLMVFFGDPEPQPDHALRGVRAAMDMQRRIRELNRVWGAGGLAPIEVRIGVNTGPMVVGNMGSSRRLSYTVIGAEVNLCRRLEASAPPGGILISQRTYEAVRDLVPTRPVEPVRAKGFPDPVVAHVVVLE